MKCNERNLMFVSDNVVSFVKYPICGEPYTVTRRLLPGEAIRAQEVLESGNDFDIDHFCYSIA